MHNAAYCYICRTLHSLCFCLLDTWVSCAKTAEPIKMSFERLSNVGPRNHVLDGGPDKRWGGATEMGDKTVMWPFCKITFNIYYDYYYCCYYYYQPVSDSCCKAPYFLHVGSPIQVLIGITCFSLLGYGFGKLHIHSHNFGKLRSSAVTVQPFHKPVM